MGGRHKHKNLTDLYVLDVRSIKDQMNENHQFSWKKFVQAEHPKPRINALLLQTEGDVYFFGGISHPENIAYDDFWKLSFGRVF